MVFFFNFLIQIVPSSLMCPRLGSSSVEEQTTVIGWCSFGIWFFSLLNLWVGEAVTVSQIFVLSFHRVPVESMPESQGKLRHSRALKCG